MNNSEYTYRRAAAKKRNDRRKRNRQMTVKSLRMVIICSILIFAVSIGGIIVKASDDSNRTRTYKYYTTVSVEDNDTDTDGNDSFWSLADRYNNGNEDTTSYINNIMQMNDLSSDTIHSGKNLVIYYYSTEVR